MTNSVNEPDARKGYFQEWEGRLEELDLMIDRMAGDESSTDNTGDGDGVYERAGRLKARLERTRRKVEWVRETRGDWEHLREDIDEAISELERAIGSAGPRFQ